MAGDVSKWLIDVHFAMLILMYSFRSLFFIFVCSFSCSSTAKKNKKFLFSTMALFRTSLPPSAHSQNVSHSNDNRHSKLLFIHGLSDGIHKSMDDCQLLVCFQLYVMISLSSVHSKQNHFLSQIRDKSLGLQKMLYNCDEIFFSPSSESTNR